MQSIWERVKQLEGTTLYTLWQHKPFKIVEVTTDLVRLVPQEGRLRRRNIRRDRIEHIAGLGLPQDILRKRVQQEYPESQNTSYYAAIVHEIGQP
jgi:hypothetical protein